MNLDKKQKILLPVTIVVLVILGWQLYGLVATPSEKEQSMPTVNSVASTETDVLADSASAVAKENPSVAPTSVAQEQKTLSSMSSEDAEYLKLVQEYQVLQLQRRIAEDTRAIAIAKLETARAISETNKVAGVSSLTNSIDMPVTKATHDYRLVFTGQENGQWAATLKINDQLMDVVPGTVLPDGYKVASVASDSVTIQKDNKQRVIGFLGISESEIKFTSAAVDAANKQANALLQAVAAESVKKNS